MSGKERLCITCKVKKFKDNSHKECPVCRKGGQKFRSCSVPDPVSPRVTRSATTKLVAPTSPVVGSPSQTLVESPVANGTEVCHSTPVTSSLLAVSESRRYAYEEGFLSHNDSGMELDISCVSALPVPPFSAQLTGNTPQKYLRCPQEESYTLDGDFLISGPKLAELLQLKRPENCKCVSPAGTALPRLLLAVGSHHSMAPLIKVRCSKCQHSYVFGGGGKWMRVLAPDQLRETVLHADRAAVPLPSNAGEQNGAADADDTAARTAAAADKESEAAFTIALETISEEEGEEGNNGDEGAQLTAPMAAPAATVAAAAPAVTAATAEQVPAEASGEGKKPTRKAATLLVNQYDVTMVAASVMHGAQYASYAAQHPGRRSVLPETFRAIERLMLPEVIATQQECIRAIRERIRLRQVHGAKDLTVIFDGSYTERTSRNKHGMFFVGDVATQYGSATAPLSCSGSSRHGTAVLIDVVEGALLAVRHYTRGEDRNQVPTQYRFENSAQEMEGVALASMLDELRADGFVVSRVIKDGDVRVVPVSSFFISG